MPEMITKMPTLADLRRQGYGSRGHTPVAREPLPRSAVGAIEQSGGNQRRLLDDMMAHVGFGDLDRDSEGIAEHAYAVVREITDSAITNRSRLAGNVLDATRGSSSYNVRFSSDGSKVNNGAVGIVRPHETRNGLAGALDYSIDIAGIYDQNSSAVSRTMEAMREFGVDISADQLRPLLVVHLAAHEAGHLVQRGIGEQKYGLHGEAAIRGWAEDIMTSEESAAVDGLRQRATDIHVERFAEGYAGVALAQACKLWGWNEQESAKIIAAVQWPRRDYAGYNQPLSIDQVVADIEYVATDSMKETNAPTGSLKDAYNQSQILSPERKGLRSSRTRKIGLWISRLMGVKSKQRD